MNVVSILLLIAVCLLQAGCQAHVSTINSQNKQLASNGQASADRELVKDVERFASGGSEASSAWQNLMRHDRQTLINDLSRISSGLPTDDRNRVFIAYTFCKLDHDYNSNRKVILSALSRKPTYRDLYGDWVVTLIGSLLLDGDEDLLAPLFQAAEWSDGAMSTDLSRVYSEALLMDAESFLASLSIQSENTRIAVIKSLHDHSLTADQSQKLKAYLKTVVSPSRRARVAAEVLKALSSIE